MESIINNLKELNTNVLQNSLLTSFITSYEQNTNPDFIAAISSALETALTPTNLYLQLKNFITESNYTYSSNFNSTNQSPIVLDTPDDDLNLIIYLLFTAKGGVQEIISPPFPQPEDNSFEYTLGAKITNPSFNPSNNSNIEYVKIEIAKIINLTQTHYSNNTAKIPDFIYEATISDLLKAQMMVVKVLTMDASAQDPNISPS
jgi:hypothetical protein